MSLRAGLRRRGVAYEAHDIWKDEDAAGFVRSVAGGNETVPTVALGDRVLVNPRASQGVELLRSEAPDRLPDRAPSRLGRLLRGRSGNRPDR
ncbi:MAG: glutaredoxin domain-containing protein [Acidimicrobiales bacterium]